MSKVTRGSVGAERAKASGAPTDPSTTSRGRFSVKKKSEAVLRLMRGESLDIVSRDNELLREKIDRLEVHRPLAHRRSRK